MNTLTRWEPFRGLNSLHDQVNRLLEDSFRGNPTDSSITAWAPAVDIFENENELVVTADLPGINEKDLDVRVENNMLTIRGIYGREMYETWYKMTVMLESGLDFSPVVTHHFAFEDFQAAFDLMQSGNSGKIILNW